MNYIENLISCMTWKKPEDLPTSSWILPAAFLKYGRELNELCARHPKVFSESLANFEFERDCPANYRVGQHTDEWGCVWHNAYDGCESIVTEHPIPTREAIRAYKPPERLTGFPPHGFMYLRICDLRGFEEAMMDFAEEPEELTVLLDMVCDANVRQVEEYCKTHGDKLLCFGDDLGTQNGLAIGPEKWRRLLKPRFKRIFDAVHAAGRYVYLHTDGQIYEIIPDLFEAGANMVNPQYRANSLDNLVRVCKGKYPINLDLDRQAMPFMSPGQCKAHIHRAFGALRTPEGGLAIELELGPDVPLANMDALAEALEEIQTEWKNYIQP